MGNEQERVADRRRRVRLATLRLVREGTFSAPEGYAETRVAIRFPRDVFDFMSPYAAREPAEAFWILPLDSQHQLIGPAPL
ncbi:MAG: hypothetical protein NVSMB53_15180 [Gemmatimonadaceae bacterium]